MPKGAAAAKKVGEFSGGSGFIQKPKGIIYFSLKNDQEQAVVRFLQQHEDIEWIAQWKTAPKPGFPYGEKIPKVDQNEDGTQDPGYALNLKSTWTGYVPLIWRNAPLYQKDGQGNYIKDGNDNRILIGYQDQVALWEHSFPVYTTLGEAEADYRGLMSRDMIVKRNGVKGSNKVSYKIVPYPIDAQPSQLSQADILLAQTQMIDIRPFVRVPTYDEVYTYLNGGQAPDSGQQQIGGPPQPMQPQPQMPGMPGLPQPGFQAAPPAPAAPPAWPAQPGQPPLPQSPIPAQPAEQFYPQAPPLTAPPQQPVPQQQPFQTQPPAAPMAPPVYPPQAAPPAPAAPPYQQPVPPPAPYTGQPQPGGEEQEQSGNIPQNPFFTS